MEIAILGNGPSRDLYNPNDPYDLRVGCNYVPLEMDYVSMADANAAKFLRKGQKYHHKINEIKLLLGRRAFGGLKTIKEVPGGMRSMADWLKETGIIHDIIACPQPYNSRQHFFTSGHQAFYWVQDTYPDARIHMFGFDVIFTGNAVASYSQTEIRNAKKVSNRLAPTKDTEYADAWNEYWNLLFENSNYKEVIVHGYEGDQDFPFPTENYNVKAVYHKKEDSDA